MQYVDPVCGRIVQSNEAGAESLHGTEHYYFCSTVCRDRFEANPAQFLGAAGQAQEREEMEKHEPPHTSVDGFTSPRFGSSTSGGAEFEPLPERHDEETEREGEKSRGGRWRER